MVEPTEERKPDDVSTDLLDRPRRCEGRYLLKQPLVRTGTIEVGLNMLPQYTMQLPSAEYSSSPATDRWAACACCAGSRTRQA